MEYPILRKIVSGLKKGNLVNDVPFFGEGELYFNDINIEIEELGELIFPLTQECTQKLLNISCQAQHESCFQTLQEENISCTQEINPAKLRVTFKDQTFSAMLQTMRDDLGLDGDTVLVPHLRSMKIYGPGQHFRSHESSEKLENVLATLMMVLPSPHVGGNLWIKHGKNEHSFSSQDISATKFKCIAFYTDCEYKMDKLEDGYHISLTYDLTAKWNDCYNPQNIGGELKSAVSEYFNGEREILVYYLDYNYNQNSLRWDVLKGTDRANSSAMHIIADELGLVTHLALVEIIKDRRSSDNEIILSDWIDKNNKKLPFELYRLEKKKPIWTRTTDSFEPYKTEQGQSEVYHWYKRAAVVLWSSQILMNFALDHDNASHELHKLIRDAGNEKRVIDIVKKAGIYLYKNPSMFLASKANFDISVTIAVYMKDEEKALSILSRFDWRVFKTDITQELLHFQTQYGINWCLKLLNNWKIFKGKAFKIFDFCYLDSMLQNLSFIISNYLQCGIATQVAKQILIVTSNFFIEKNKRIISESKNSIRDFESTVPIEQILLSDAKLQDTKVLSKIIDHVISAKELYSESELFLLFQKLQNHVPTEYYQALKVCAIKAISKQIPLSSQILDWSFNMPLFCKCSYCKLISSFLRSVTDESKVLFVKEEICKHIVTKFKSYPYTVDLCVERTFKANKLVIVKRKTLLEKAEKRVSNLKSFLQKMEDI